MNCKDLTLLALIMALDLGISLLGNPVLNYIKIYLEASLIFMVTSNSGMKLFYLLIFDSTREILKMIRGYPLYISAFEYLLQSYPPPIAISPDQLFLQILIWTPFMKLLAIQSARLTVRRLKIRERLGI